MSNWIIVAVEIVVGILIVIAVGWLTARRTPYPPDIPEEDY